MSEDVRQECCPLSRAEVKGPFYPYAPFPAIVDEIENAQEMEVGRVVPFIGQRRGDRNPSPLMPSWNRVAEGCEVREADDHPRPHPQGLLEDFVRLLHLLEGLIEDDKIERL